MQIANRLLIVLLCIGLVSCANQPRRAYLVGVAEPQANVALFSQGVHVETPEEIFNLTAAQREAFYGYFHVDKQHLAANRRIANYLQKLTTGFNYQEKTYNAAQAIELGRGNCMALVVVTTALAKLVNVDISFQLMTNMPLYDRDNGIVMVSDHVRARLYRPPVLKWNSDQSQRGAYISIDYFPTEGRNPGVRINETELLALYYRNRAVEYLLDNNLDHAFAYAQESLNLDPLVGHSINLMGLIHRRAGDNNTAEAFYQYALALFPEDSNALQNYIVLLKLEQRYDEAKHYQTILNELPDNDPFRIIVQAERAYQARDYHKALALYRRAEHRAPYLHEVYWGQAEVYHALGRTDSAYTVWKYGLGQAAESLTEEQYMQGWEERRQQIDHKKSRS